MQGHYHIHSANQNYADGSFMQFALLYSEYVDGNLKSKQKTPEEEMMNPFSENVLCNNLIGKDIKTL